MENILFCYFLEASYRLLRLRIFILLQETEYQICPINIIKYLLHLVSPSRRLDIKANIENNCKATIHLVTSLIFALIGNYSSYQAVLKGGLSEKYQEAGEMNAALDAAS